MAVFLKEGYLPWFEVESRCSELQALSVKQLIWLWKNTKDRKGDPSVWGDEVEYEMIRFDHSKQEVYLSVKQDEILAKAQETPPEQLDFFEFQPEYASYMLESTPIVPYTTHPRRLAEVEDSMLRRRKVLTSLLDHCEAPLTMSMFPRLGAAGQFSNPRFALTALNASSRYVPDELISSKARYQAFEINCRSRRGMEAKINVPVFEDITTVSSLEPVSQQSGISSLDMDATIFGAGGCGVQVTFQAENIDEARNLHDQLLPIGPLMMALTASTPIYKGLLVDTDTRWNYFAAATNDQKASEVGSLPYRWSVSPSYLNKNVANVLDDWKRDLPINTKLRKSLEEEGIDEVLAHYFATYFVRDPLLVRKRDYEGVSEENTDLFDALYASVWPHIRFKFPPPSKLDMGWRIEFRMMEIQHTDFENAAFSIFVALLRATIRHFQIDFYMPISNTDRNTDIAHMRDAVLRERFYFPPEALKLRAADDQFPSWQRRDVSLMTIDEIFNGDVQSGSDGLVGLVERYLYESGATSEEMDQLSKYLSFIRRRAKGEESTPARWIRNFVTGHPEYANDSVVNPRICYDLVKAIVERNTAGSSSDKQVS